jgi:hypothetical protein
MQDSQSSNRANAPIDSPRSEVTAAAAPSQDDDAGLLTLEEQFDKLVLGNCSPLSRQASSWAPVYISSHSDMTLS